MKLSDYAKQVGVSYITAYRWFKSGQVKGYQIGTGTIIITEMDEQKRALKVAVYARVSPSEKRASLESQAEKLVDYCTTKGWQVSQIIKEIGSGVDDNRPKLDKLLRDPSYTLIVVEHKERLASVGFNYIASLMEAQERKLDIMNLAEDEDSGLIEI